MTNESQIREILKRIDALHQDVEALLPKVEIPRPERSPAMCIHAATHGVPAHGRPVNVPSCPAIRVPSAAVKFSSVLRTGFGCVVTDIRHPGFAVMGEECFQ